MIVPLAIIIIHRGGGGSRRLLRWMDVLDYRLDVVIEWNLVEKLIHVLEHFGDLGIRQRDLELLGDGLDVGLRPGEGDLFFRALCLHFRLLFFAGAPDGNRTRILALEGRYSTIVPQARLFHVVVPAGFEPAAGRL